MRRFNPARTRRAEVSNNKPHLQQLRFRLTRDDFAAFESLPTELNGWNRLYFLGPAALAGGLYGAFGDDIRRALPFAMNDTVWWLLAMAVLVAFSYAAMSALLTVRYFRRVEAARVPATETVIETFEDGFTLQESNATRTLAWRDVTVIPAPAHVFLCPSPRAVIIVPLRAFASQDAMRAFATFAEAAGRDSEDVPNEKDDAHVP